MGRLATPSRERLSTLYLISDLGWQTERHKPTDSRCTVEPDGQRADVRATTLNSWEKGSAMASAKRGRHTAEPALPASLPLMGLSSNQGG